MSETVTLSKETLDKLCAKAQVDAAIVDVIVPQLYTAIDDLLDFAHDAPKDLVMRAKKLLPAWAPHSMEQSPPKGKNK